jgi:hypothetical protein
VESGGAETAAYIAAGVALVVGLISPIFTAVMAGRRQRAELHHDRELRSREDRVQVLDEAAEAIAEMRTILGRLAPVGQQQPQQRGAQEQRELLAAWRAIRAVMARSEIHFGRTSRVTEALVAALGGLATFNDVIDRQREQPYSEERSAAIKEAAETQHQTENAFLYAAHEHLRQLGRLPTKSSPDDGQD